MGFHTCEACKIESPNNRPATSSGDVTLHFQSNLAQSLFVVPDMIFHYILEHGYMPPDHFVNSVLYFELNLDKLGDKEPERIGYLGKDFPRMRTEGPHNSLSTSKGEIVYVKGWSADKTLTLLRRLRLHLDKAAVHGFRRQTRGG